MSFSADITQFVIRTKIRADQVLRKVAFDGLRGVVEESPVLTGRFKGNWRVGVQTNDLSTTEQVDPAGGVTAAQGQAKLATAKFGQTIYITNNLPYAKALEEGHSKKAPQGMLGITFERLKMNLSDNVRRIRDAGY